MDEEAAFLSAIAAAPEDATARLAFADWLGDRDDFRAEFVRAAVAFEHTPPYNPERFRLAERLRELLGSPTFKAWLPASPALEWGWRRGLLSLAADTRSLEAEDASQLADRLASHWIERAVFNGYTSGMPDWADTFSLVRNARELHFGTDNYGPDVFTHLREWPHLRALSMSYLGDGDAWSDLAALPHLRSLALDNPDWTMMPELHNARLPNLEALNLDKEWNDDLPHWNVCFPRLRSLSLTHYNSYPDEQCARFAECPHLRRLALYQRYQPLKAAGLKALAKAKELRSLTFGPLPRGTIEAFAKLPNLEHLHVWGEGKQVRGLENLTGLKWLTLGLHTLTRDAAAQVVALPQLTRLDLSCRAFETGAIAALATTGLRVLALSVRDQMPLSELARLEGLQYLRIESNTLAPAELLSLQAALPHCRIDSAPLDFPADDYDWN